MPSTARLRGVRKSMNDKRVKGFAAITTVVVATVAAIGFVPNDVRAEISIESGKSCMSSSCHTKIADRGKSHLMAAEGQSCSVCHTAPDPGTHEFRFAAPGGDLCTRCHATIADGSHKHVPVAAGMCTVCHKIHRADHPKQLSTAPKTLCNTCHNQIVPPAARTAHLPASEGQCILCHDPHSSNFDKQLKSPVPDLCFGCHDQPQQDEDGTTLPPTQPHFDDKSLNQHPSFARGECLMCHNPHASETYRLQKQSYPKSLYTSFSTDKYFCFNCHGTRGFTEARTLSETDFRNGNLNLHYRHVNREKGRSCRACHHHHASDRDSLITEKVLFGDRQIEIKDFEKTDTGGRCEPSCHRSVLYDRITPASNNLLVTEREGTDATLEELEQNFEIIDGALLYERRCAGCHGVDADGKVAPAIHGATMDMVTAAIGRLPPMKGLTSLTDAELQAIVDAIPDTSVTPAAAVSSEPAATGEGLYAAKCAPCHGADAKGLMGPEITGASSEDIKAAIDKVPMMQMLNTLTDDEVDVITEFLSGQDDR